MYVAAVAVPTLARLPASEMLKSSGAASLNALSTLRLVAASGEIAFIILLRGPRPGRALNPHGDTCPLWPVVCHAYAAGTQQAVN